MKQSLSQRARLLIRHVLDLSFGADTRSLAAFRITLALLIIGDLVLRALDLTAFYTDAGAMPRQAMYNGALAPWHWSAHLLGGSALFEGALFLLAGLIAVFLLIGWRTRLMTVVSWLLLISLHTRNHLVLQGGDVLLRMLLFWAMFLPLGARCSVDALWSKKTPQRVLSIGTAALGLQIAMMYFFSALLKNSPEWTTDGTAAYYALSLDQMATPLGHFMLNFPTLLQDLTHFIYAAEAIGPVLLLLPFSGPARTGVVALFIGLHAGFASMLHLGHFTWIAWGALLFFLPAWFWDKVEKVRMPRVLLRWSSSIGAQCRKMFARRDPPSVSLPIAASCLALFFLVYCLAWNIGTLQNAPYHLPPDSLWLGQLTRVDQHWGMFAPFPLKEDGWYILKGNMDDGSITDMFRDGAPVKWDKPTDPGYPRERWRKYLMNLWAIAHAQFRAPYLSYVCSMWNTAHPNARLKSVDMLFLLEMTEPLREAQPRQVPLHSYICPAAP